MSVITVTQGTSVLRERDRTAWAPGGTVLEAQLECRCISYCHNAQTTYLTEAMWKPETHCIFAHRFQRVSVHCGSKAMAMFTEARV